VGVLLMAAAPLLVVGGIIATSDAGSPAEGPAQVAEHRTPPAVPVPVPDPTPGTPPQPARGLRPDVVVVPALDVRAPVSPIATQGGALTPPSDPQQVGWWSGGARPGSSAGAAVVTGHTVHTGGGAFDDLETLAAGDPVVVEAGPRTLAYEVQSVEVLSRAELARRSATIFARSGQPRLVLITCEDWDGSAYSSNVVVTARPVR
jgi:LPXTG-site transpeptidase (sortase) family protein